MFHGIAFHVMRTRLPQGRNLHELGFVSSGLWICGGVVALGLLALSFRPSLSQADALLVSGAQEEAASVYAAVATDGLTQDARGDALWRAARLARAENHPRQALSLLQRFCAEHPDSPRVAEAHAARAELHRAELGETAAAARAWTQAARTTSDLAAAGGWWLRAGRTWVEAGEPARARRAFRAATGIAETRATAWMSLGNLDLADDPAAAYDAYDHALSEARGEGLVALARLGMATAMERLDGAEAALAEVSSQGEEDSALERRRARLSGTVLP